MSVFRSNLPRNSLLYYRSTSFDRAPGETEAGHPQQAHVEAPADQLPDPIVQASRVLDSAQRRADPLTRQDHGDEA